MIVMKNQELIQKNLTELLFCAILLEYPFLVKKSKRR